MRVYRFNLVCPACGQTSETVADRRVPPPRVNCGECLMERVDIVEYKVVRVDVEQSAA